MKRLFIAINLPKTARDKIGEAIAGLEKIYPNERFISPENWHLTISFLGYQPDEAFGPILEAIKETAANFSGPEIELEKIILAPPDKPEKRMVWLIGAEKTSEMLGELKNNLEEKLMGNKVAFKPENRQYNSHLTLVRMEYPSRSFLAPDLPDFRPIVFRAESLDLMESHLNPVRNRPAEGTATIALGRSVSNGVKRSGAEYEVLSAFKFAQ
jgi:2'-5' RNA ligase